MTCRRKTTEKTNACKESSRVLCWNLGTEHRCEMREASVRPAPLAWESSSACIYNRGAAQLDRPSVWPVEPSSRELRIPRKVRRCGSRFRRVNWHGVHSRAVTWRVLPQAPGHCLIWWRHGHMPRRARLPPLSLYLLPCCFVLFNASLISHIMTLSDSGGDLTAVIDPVLLAMEAPEIPSEIGPIRTTAFPPRAGTSL